MFVIYKGLAKANLISYLIPWLKPGAIEMFSGLKPGAIDLFSWLKPEAIDFCFKAEARGN
jgi:hypothetical protein